MTGKQIIANVCRCEWCGTDAEYIAYHDSEWGVPLTDDRKLFEMLVLEGAQAGLSWLTILKRRENYRAAFHNFDVEKIAQYDDTDVARLLANEDIIRNRLKIKSAINNAQQFLKIEHEFGSFSQYLWGFVDNKPIVNHYGNISELPTTSPLAQRISKDLKKRGMSFVGSVIIYSYLQAVGVIDDHIDSCYLKKRGVSR